MGIVFLLQEQDHEVELLAGGGEIDVTTENVEEYIELMLDMIFNQGVSLQM